MRSVGSHSTSGNIGFDAVLFSEDDLYRLQRKSGPSVLQFLVSNPKLFAILRTPTIKFLANVNA